MPLAVFDPTICDTFFKRHSKMFPINDGTRKFKFFGVEQICNPPDTTEITPEYFEWHYFYESSESGTRASEAS